MLKDITIGQYYPGNSFVHRLDPRFKIIITLLYITMLFMGSHLYSMVFGHFCKGAAQEHETHSADFADYSDSGLAVHSRWNGLLVAGLPANHTRGRENRCSNDHPD